MSITIPKPPDLAVLRAERDALDKKIMAARRRYERRVEKALAGVTVKDIKTYDDVMAVLGAPGRKPHDLMHAWVKSLGSTDLRYDGNLIDPWSGKVFGPALVVTVPHPKTGYGDYAERFGGLMLALSRYMEIMEPVMDDLGAEGLVVKIMDNDLSESGIPELYLHRDGSCEFAMTVYGSTRNEKSWPTLADAIEWVALNRWYGEPYPEREERW